MKKNFNANSVANKLIAGIGKQLKKEDLQSGLSKMTSGNYFYVRTKTETIEGRNTALALFTNDSEDKVFACGATKFATFLGAVGRDEQKSMLEDPNIVGNEYKITVTGEGTDKVTTFEAVN